VGYYYDESIVKYTQKVDDFVEKKPHLERPKVDTQITLKF
jgi:hypothetical protein